MRKKLYLSLTSILILALLAGCGQIQLPADADQKEEEKELTTEEVLTKASEKLEKLDGISFDSKREGKVKLEEDGTEMTMEAGTEVHTELVFEPLALYGKGTSREDGETKQVEAYLANENLYLKEPNFGEWIEQGSTPVDEQLETSLEEMDTVDPREVLNKIKEDMKDYLKMEREDGSYILIFEPDKQTARELMKKWKEEDPESSFTEEDLENLDIQKVSQRIWIDEETFEFKKIKQHVIMDGVMGDTEEIPAYVDVQTGITINGEVKSITPPDDLDEDDF